LVLRCCCLTSLGSAIVACPETTVTVTALARSAASVPSSKCAMALPIGFSIGATK
jgi:hypothetical protein